MMIFELLGALIFLIILGIMGVTLFLALWGTKK